MVGKMVLNNYQKMSYRWFGNFAEKRSSEKLQLDLESAHIDLRGSVYITSALLTSILGLLISFVVISIFILILFPMVGIFIDVMLTTFFLIIPLIIAGLIYVIFLIIPGSMAKSRGKKIDRDLAYALNFISAMTSAGVTPTESFRSLSKQEIYGEVKEEASWIYRDVALLGSDILTAIKTNIKRTPSQRFKEFSQGLIVTVTSGGSLKSYFSAKAEQYMWDYRQDQKQLIESLSIMAESYVTTAVAGILLLLIVIPLMMIISGDFNFVFLYLLIFMVIPFIHMGFSVVIKSMSQG
jgi:flagellar protein FlaJ